MAEHRSSGAGAPLEPTFNGLISTTMDGLILFEACLCGRLSHVPRRPHDRERASLIRSGHVFIYEEHSSGIKRWTDGVSWSPSRILGNFLLYRELDKPFQPGEKKRAMKRKPEAGVSKPGSAPRSNSISYTSTITPLATNRTPFDSNNGNNGTDSERQFVGSLVDSYQFKPDGLIKKTISIQYRGVQHHMVSYYSLEDALNKKLMTPSNDPSLNDITPRAALITSATFRAPVDDNEFMVSDQRMSQMYGIPPQQLSEYGVISSVAAARSMSVPNIQQYPNAWGGHTSYASNPNYALTASLPPMQYSQPNYAYNQQAMNSYRMPPSSQPHQSYHSAAVMQARGPLALPGPTEGSHLDYSSLGATDRARLSSTTSLPNNYNLPSHRLSQSTVNGGGVYDQSGAANPPSHGSSTYGLDGPSRQDGHYEDENGESQQSDGFDSLEASAFDPTSARHHHMSDFGVSLSEATAAFASVSHNSTQSVPFSLEHSESASTSMAGNEMTAQWPATLGGSSHY